MTEQPGRAATAVRPAGPAPDRSPASARPDRPRPAPARTGRRLSLAQLEPVLVAAVTIAGTGSFGAFYGSLGWLAPLAGAIALGAALGAIAAARRWRAWLTLPVAAVLFAAFALYVCYPRLTSYGLPGPAALRALGDGLRSGWAKMLTVALPADVTGDLLITPLLLAFVLGLLGAVLTVRTTAVTPLALPPLLLFVAGLLVTAERPGSRLLLTGAVLVAVLLLVLVRSNRVATADHEGIEERDADAVGLDLAARRWHSTLGRVAFGLPVIALVTVAGLVGAATLPVADGSDRFDVRELHRETFRLSTALTPLVQLKPQLNGSPSTLFTVAVRQRGGETTVNKVRVATLDSFDGALWTQSRDFVVAGTRLPPGPPLTPPVVTVELDVQVTRLLQPFLPVVGRPTEVTGGQVAFDTANGTLVSTRERVAGFGYRTTAQVRPTDASLRSARPSTTPADAAYRALPNVPAWVTERADEITAGRQTAYTQLAAIEKYLNGRPYNDGPGVRPGHSYGAVFRTLLGQPEEQIGYAEQYASAFAILARAKGYPARVAVGYKLLPQQRAGDRFEVTTRAAHAWPEVHLAGFGWVAFEPTNADNPAENTPPRDSTAPVLPDKPVPPRVREPERDATTSAVETSGGGGIAGAVRTALFVLIGLLVALVALVVLVVLAKAERRRRRRRRGTPAQRIVAAWREVVDRMRERGLPVHRSLTAVEVAAGVPPGPAARAAPSLRELATLVTVAIYAPEQPPPPAAARAWELEGTARKALLAATPLLVRVRALVDPRPLLPRRAASRQRRSAPAAERRVTAGRGGRP